MAKPPTPSQLLAALKAEELTVREMPGWRDRCRCHDGSHEKGERRNSRGWGTWNGTVTHITAGNLNGRTVEKYIRDIINGDPNTPTKAQIVTAPDGEVWLNSAGRCNHAGKVGAQVQAHLVAADFSTTDDYDDRFRGAAVDGNSFTIGNEVIAASKMNAAQYTSAVKVAAALARFAGWAGQESVGHGEISSARYKVDPGLDMGKFRRDVMARVKAGSKAPAPKPAPEPTPPAPIDVPTDDTNGWLRRMIDYLTTLLKGLPAVEPTPTPTPTPPPPEPAKTATFWGGYGNLYAPYTFTADWNRRAPLLAATVKTMGVSFFIALEGHGDTTKDGGDNKVELARAADGSMRPIYAPFLWALPNSWTIAEGEGGNHLFYDKNKYQILKTRDELMPGKRWMTGWKVRHTATSETFWINAAHLTAGSTAGRIADREAQGRFLAKTINTTAPVILGADVNNPTKYAGSPRVVLEADGLLGLREKATVKNGGQPSHHGGKAGQWLDDLFTSPSVKVDRAELVDTGDLSDHDFLKARLTVTTK